MVGCVSDGVLVRGSDVLGLLLARFVVVFHSCDMIKEGYIYRGKRIRACNLLIL
jgi:hypothetical protein